MLETVKKTCGRTGFILFEVFLVFGLLVVVFAGGLAWRLASSPLDIEFAKSTIEEALRDETRGLSVQSDKIVLHWPDLRGPILIGLQGGRILNSRGDVILSIEEVAVGVNKARLLIGQVAPEVLVIRRPSLRVVRMADGTFDVGLGGEREAFDGGEDTDIIADIIGFLEGKDEGRSSPLAKLKRFEIAQASVVVEDQVLGLNWEATTADAAFTKVSEGVMADVKVVLPPQGDLDSGVLFGVAVLNKASKNISVGGRLERFRPSFLAEKIPDIAALKYHEGLVNAKFETLLDETMRPQFFDLTALSDEGNIRIAAWSDVPQVYKNLGVSVRYDGETGAVDLRKGQVTFGEVVIDSSAEFSTGLNNVNGSFRIEIEKLLQGDIEPLWPQSLKDEAAYEWIVEKLSDGVFSDVYAQGDLALNKGEEGWVFNPDDDLKNVRAGFLFDGMSVDYRNPMAAVTGAKGRGEFILDEEKLRIDIETAQVLDMDIPNAELEFYNIIEAGKGTADVNLKLNGSLASALKYVSAEPLKVKPDFDVVNAKGAVALDINLGFPTHPDIEIEDFDIDIKGELSDATIPKLLKNMTLTGGPFKIGIDSQKLQIEGAGQLAGRPVSAVYEEFLDSKGQAYSSRVKANMVVDEGIRQELGMDLSAFMDGAAAVDLVYTSLGGGDAEALVKADLSGSRLYVEPFDYEKPAGLAGSVSLTAILKAGVLTEVKNLTGIAPNLKLENSVFGFAERGGETELSMGRISRFALGETVSSLEFEIAPSGVTKIVMNGGFMDLRPFLADEEDKDKPYDSPPMQIYLSMDRMRTADEETVQYGKIFVDIDGAGKINQMEMDGIAGTGDLYLRYKPDASGKRVFRFEADDAGAALKAFDLYDDIRGGKMVIYGEPIRGVFDRNLLGRAELTNFRVVNAPALAKLLGVMSLSGLGQTLNGEGLVFTKLESKFDWLYRPKGSLLVLKDGRTSGNSLGLTFDGTFDKAQNYVDVKGTIIPLSGVNKVIGDIPLLGDLLTGGTGALIAATYTMEGEGKEPEVSVNPLSALTPGILRRILFEN